MALAALIAGLSLLGLSAIGQPAPQPLAGQLRPAVTGALSLADFDGDDQPDRAELFSGGAHKSIQVSLSSSWTRNLSFDSKTPADGVLLAQDINHDSDLDLIWVSQSQLVSAVVWLGDGRGNFKIVQEPEAYAPALRSLLGSDDDASLSEGAGDKDLACDSAPVNSFELAPATKLELDAPPKLAAASVERRRDLALCLAYLRERGPPSSIF